MHRQRQALCASRPHRSRLDRACRIAGIGRALRRRGERVTGRGLGALQGRGSSAARPAAAAVTPAPTPAVQPAAAVAPVTEQPSSNSAPSNGASGWGWGGTTLAQKLKQAEIQKLLPTPVPVPEILVEEVNSIALL